MDNFYVLVLQITDTSFSFLLYSKTFGCHHPQFLVITTCLAYMCRLFIFKEKDPSDNRSAKHAITSYVHYINIEFKRIL